MQAQTMLEAGSNRKTFNHGKAVLHLVAEHCKRKKVRPQDVLL